MKRTLVSVVLVMCVCPLTVSACSSTGGESGKAAAQIFTDAENATASVQSVHVTGSFANAGFNSIDLDVGQTVGGGSVVVNQQPLSVYADQQGVYIKATPATWLALSKNPISERWGNRWVEFPSSSAIYSQFGVNSVEKLITTTLNQDPKSLAKGTVTTFRGLKAISLHAPNQTIYVAATGTPYLLGIVGTGGVVFDEFNTAVVPSAPASSTPAANLIK